MNSGSLLGAVKLNNFIPWDIDGDLYMLSNDLFKHFGNDGEGRRMFREAGISCGRLWPDNYADKGAGYFLATYNGIEFEMMGKLNKLSLDEVKLMALKRRRIIGYKSSSRQRLDSFSSESGKIFTRSIWSGIFATRSILEIFFGSIRFVSKVQSWVLESVSCSGTSRVSRFNSGRWEY